MILFEARLIKQVKKLVHLVHPKRHFPLLQTVHKTQSHPGLQGEVFLRKTVFLTQRLYNDRQFRLFHNKLYYFECKNTTYFSIYIISNIIILIFYDIYYFSYRFAIKSRHQICTGWQFPDFVDSIPERVGGMRNWKT